MFLLFSRSQPEDSPEMREITRQLRRALDNVEDLNKKNKQLKDEAISLRLVGIFMKATWRVAYDLCQVKIIVSSFVAKQTGGRNWKSWYYKIPSSTLGSFFIAKCFWV